jgi:hypothetical protein
MPQLELTEQEAEYLVETLTSVLSNLSYEIADTDNYDFRETLKEKREALSRIAETLKGSS